MHKYLSAGAGMWLGRENSTIGFAQGAGTKHYIHSEKRQYVSKQCDASHITASDLIITIHLKKAALHQSASIRWISRRNVKWNFLKLFSVKCISTHIPTTIQNLILITVIQLSSFLVCFDNRNLYKLISTNTTMMYCTQQFKYKFVAIQ